MMRVRLVRMIVPNGACRCTSMCGSARTLSGAVIVAMVIVVHVQMLVLERLVGLLVPTPLAKQEHDGAAAASPSSVGRSRVAP